MRYKKSQELYIFFFYILTPFGVYKTTLDDFKTGTRLPSDESTIVSVRLSPFYRRVTLVCKPFQTLQDVFMMSPGPMNSRCCSAAVHRRYGRKAD